MLRREVVGALRKMTFRDPKGRDGLALADGGTKMSSICIGMRVSGSSESSHGQGHEAVAFLLSSDGALYLEIWMFWKLNHEFEP